MKHLITLLLLCLSIPIIAQEYDLNANYIIVSDNNGTIIDKDEVDIDMTLNLDEDRLVIYSKRTQIIDYEVLREYIDEDGYATLECTATDSDWKNIMLEILVSSEKKSILVMIFYKDYSYCYICTI